MFYFGWRRSDVQARQMGIDVSLFGFSTQDYVLRSIGSLYLPLLVTASLGLAALVGHARVERALASGTFAGGSSRQRSALAWATRTRNIGGAVAAGGVVFAGAAGLSPPPPVVGWLAARLRDSQWVVPLVMVAATVVAVYAWWLCRRLEPAPAGPPGPLWESVTAA